MNNEINGVLLYKTHIEVIEALGDTEQLIMYKALINYGLRQITPTFNNVLLDSIFKLIKPNIDASISKRLNGSKGGRPPKTPPNAAPAKAETTILPPTIITPPKNEVESVESEESIEVILELEEILDNTQMKAIHREIVRNKIFDGKINNIKDLNQTLQNYEPNR